VSTGSDACGIGGGLVLPELSCRCVDCRKAVAKGFQGELTDWVRSTGVARSENDQVRLGTVEFTVVALIAQQNDTIRMAPDPLDLVFVEK
jgi:hypothetical protein